MIQELSDYQVSIFDSGFDFDFTLEPTLNSWLVHIESFNVTAVLRLDDFLEVAGRLGRMKEFHDGVS